MSGFKRASGHGYLPSGQSFDTQSGALVEPPHCVVCDEQVGSLWQIIIMSITSTRQAALNQTQFIFTTTFEETYFECRWFQCLDWYLLQSQFYIQHKPWKSPINLELWWYFQSIPQTQHLEGHGGWMKSGLLGIDWLFNTSRHGRKPAIMRRDVASKQVSGGNYWRKKTYL